MQVHKSPQPNAEWLTIGEFAEQARIGRSLAYQLIRDGRIPALRLGRLIRISRSALADYANGAIGADR